MKNETLQNDRVASTPDCAEGRMSTARDEATSTAMKRILDVATCAIHDQVPLLVRFGISEPFEAPCDEIDIDGRHLMLGEWYIPLDADTSFTGRMTGTSFDFVVDGEAMRIRRLDTANRG